MVEGLPDRGLVVGCGRAADLRQHLGWGDRVGPPLRVGQQLGQGAAPVVWVTVRRKARHSHSMRLASGS
jgi:hypothetical protein